MVLLEYKLLLFSRAPSSDKNIFFLHETYSIFVYVLELPVFIELLLKIVVKSLRRPLDNFLLSFVNMQDMAIMFFKKQLLKIVIGLLHGIS